MKLSIVALHNQARLASPEPLLSSVHLQGFFAPFDGFDALPESPVCHARGAHGKMQRDFAEHEKGKSFITVECSFVSAWKVVFILTLGNSYGHMLIEVVEMYRVWHRFKLRAWRCSHLSGRLGMEGRRVAAAGCEHEACGHDCGGQRQQGVKIWSRVLVSMGCRCAQGPGSACLFLQ